MPALEINYVCILMVFWIVNHNTIGIIYVMICCTFGKSCAVLIAAVECTRITIQVFDAFAFPLVFGSLLIFPLCISISWPLSLRHVL